VRRVQVVADGSALAAEGARIFETRAREAVAASGRFTVALSGGRTPKALYSLLAGRGLPWAQIHLFWGDERCVPRDHPDSNYAMVKGALLDPGHVPPESVHAVPVDNGTPAEVARDYEIALRGFFKAKVPRFDLVLLGMGPDGHTASLFPGTPGLQEMERLVVPAFVERLQSHRVTLTFPVLNGAAQVLFLVEGKDKATALKSVLSGGPEPAGRVLPGQGEVLWLVDSTAAAELPPELARG
jgi:6-phosphogluconolactonase